MFRTKFNSNNFYVTSDLHFDHINICRGTSKWDSGYRDFNNPKEMNETLIRNINKVVPSSGHLFILGDIKFGDKQQLPSLLGEIKCKNIYYLYGNHSMFIRQNDYYQKLFKWCGDYLEIFVDKQLICMFHYGCRVWNESHRGSWMLYGHCFDNETELLTKNGWKKGKDLLFQEEVVTLNLENNQLEWNNVLDIFKYDYTGEMYSIKGRRFDLLVTPNHGLLDVKFKNKKILKYIASDFKKLKNRGFRTCGNLEKTGVQIDDDLLRLGIWITTDGSFENSCSVRFHLKKERKILRLEELLKKLKIEYSKKGPSIKNTYKIYFKIPEEIRKYNWKPLDKIFFNLNHRQVQILLEEYAVTDGCYQSKNSIQISSSKKEERDLLQSIFCTSNISSNNSERKLKTGILSVLKNKDTNYINTKNSLKIIDDNKIKKIWCCKVKNGTLLIRKNGKICITQNSHGSLPDNLNAKSTDIGMDTEYSLFNGNLIMTANYNLQPIEDENGFINKIDMSLYDNWDKREILHKRFTPFSYRELDKIMCYKNQKMVDHHGSRANME